MSAAITPPLAAPYDGLTPEVLFDALESVGWRPDGRLMALNSYENRVYQVGLDDAEFCVVKVYRPARWSDAAIDEEHAFVAELAEAELPVVAPMAVDGVTLHRHAGFRFAVFPRQGGRAPEFDNLDTLRWMGRLMARIHVVGARRPFVARPTLDIETFGRSSLQLLAAQGCVPEDLKSAYFSVAEQALLAVSHAYARAGEVATLRLHGDCHVGNVLWGGRAGGGDPHNSVTVDGPHFVDFDDARQGPAIQDLWMLLSGDADRQRQQGEALIEAYRAFRDFNSAEWHLAEALRTLRLIHHAAWIAKRWDDPAFPLAFSWFGSPRYWQDRILELREQCALLSEVPVWLA